MSIPASLLLTFSLSQIKQACKEAMNLPTYLEPGLYDCVGKGDSVSPRRKNPTDSGAWWKNQIRNQIVHAKAEGVEREQRRQYAITLSNIEQARRVQEEINNALEDAEERKRRREYAKAVIREEQWTKIREQFDACSRDEAERLRRRRTAVKSLKAEEARQIELRLQGKAMLKTNNFQLAIKELEIREALRRRNRALFQAGIRLHMQYFRAVENDRFAAAGNRIDIKRSKVEQAVRDIYLRDCLDPDDCTTSSEVSALAPKEVLVPVRTSSFRPSAGLHEEISREVLGAMPAHEYRMSSAADFFRPMPIPGVDDYQDTIRMSV
jgi:hypothetical protein